MADFGGILKCWCHALYLTHKKANNHESRFNLFGLINQQYIVHCYSFIPFDRTLEKNMLVAMNYFFLFVLMTLNLMWRLRVDEKNTLLIFNKLTVFLIVGLRQKLNIIPLLLLQVNFCCTHSTSLQVP